MNPKQLFWLNSDDSVPLVVTNPTFDDLSEAIDDKESSVPKLFLVTLDEPQGLPAVETTDKTLESKVTPDAVRRINRKERCLHSYQDLVERRPVFGKKYIVLDLTQQVLIGHEVLEVLTLTAEWLRVIVVFFSSSRDHQEMIRLICGNR